MAAPDTDPDREARAEAMRPVAMQFVDRLRYEHPDVIYRDLIAHLTWREVVDLLFLVAGAPDPHATPTEWWGWVWVQLTCVPRATAGDEPDGEVSEDDGSLDHMTDAELDRLVARLAGKGWDKLRIGEETCMSADAVRRRLGRLRQGREPVGAGVPG